MLLERKHKDLFRKQGSMLKFISTTLLALGNTLMSSLPFKFNWMLFLNKKKEFKSWISTLTNPTPIEDMHSKLDPEERILKDLIKEDKKEEEVYLPKLDGYACPYPRRKLSGLSE